MGAFIPPPSDPQKLRDHVRGPGGWASATQLRLLVDFHANISDSAEVLAWRLTYQKASAWYVELKAAQKTGASQHRPGLYEEPPGGWDDAPPAQSPAVPAPPAAPVPPSGIVPAPPAQALPPASATAPVAGYDTDTVDLVMRTVLPKEATLDHLKLYLMTCKQHGLAPLMRHMYTFFDKKDGKLVISPTIDGFFAIAEQTGEFSGVGETKFEYATNDERTHENIRHPARATATIYRRDRQTGERYSVSASASWEEYNRPGRDYGRGYVPSMWDKMPETMLEKVALARALRRAFPRTLSGLYDADEFREETHRDLPPRRLLDIPPSREPWRQSGTSFPRPSPPPEHSQEAGPPPAQSTGGAGGPVSPPPTGGQSTTPPSGGQPAPPAGGGHRPAGGYNPAECDMLRGSIHHLLDSADPERKERAQAEFREALEAVHRGSLPECNEEELRWILRRMMDALGM